MCSSVESQEDFYDSQRLFAADDSDCTPVHYTALNAYLCDPPATFKAGVITIPAVQITGSEKLGGLSKNTWLKGGGAQ